MFNSKLKRSEARPFILYAVSWFLVSMVGVVFAGEDPNPINDASHFDAIVTITPPATIGGRISIDAAGVFARDFKTRRVLIPANFGDFAGGPYKTDDPGWVVSAGQLLAGETLHYRALNHLLFWDKNLQRWSAQVPRGETVHLFGEIPTEVILRNDAAELALFKQGTIWHVGGIAGPREAAIEAADSGGGIHAHLDFCVQDSGGDCSLPGLGHSGAPSVGAYLIELQAFVADIVNGQAKYRAANPLFIALNRGLSTADFHRALAALTIAPPSPETRPLPAAGILILSRND